MKSVVKSSIIAFSQDPTARVNMDNMETQPMEESQQAWVKLHALLPFLYIDPQQKGRKIELGSKAYDLDDAFSDCSTGRCDIKKGKRIPRGTYQDTSSAFLSCSMFTVSFFTFLSPNYFAFLLHESGWKATSSASPAG